MVWKVAGEFLSPKNITVGSNNPSGVRNTPFHLSPSLILMLLYPHQISNVTGWLAGGQENCWGEGMSVFDPQDW